MNERLAQQLQRLPELLGHHLQITLVAMAAGILFSIPLAVWVTRHRRLQGPALGLASVVQTIPSLALLALMVPLLGMIGFVPALLALILYSILPILRNTVTGLSGVDPALVEAARGMGMTSNQMLMKVQFPLAAPVIIAGVRTSAVWVVGIATLSTPVGQESLGNYIFQGLQTQNHYATMTGVVAAAGLAIVLDLLIRGMELASIRRSRGLALAAGVGLLVVSGAAAAPFLQRGVADERPLVTIGAKTFTEQYVLAEMLTEHLRRDGFRPQTTGGMGSTILFDALAQGNVDAYVDYSGTIWATVMQRSDVQDAQTVLEEVTEYLKANHGITCLGPLGFENAYCLAMPREKAEELGIRTVSDLARHAPTMRIGGDYEFFARPEWERVRDAYGLNFQKAVNLDSALMYSAAKEGEVDAIVAFSSDGRIVAYDLVVLDDPRQAFPPYDAVLLVSPQASESPELMESLRQVVGTIDDDAMRQANKAVDVDGESPERVGTRLAENIPSQ